MASNQALLRAHAEEVLTPRIDLAHAASFRLGAVVVEPSRLRLTRSGYEHLHVEPRVMQVLSVLHDAAGAVVGRDDLIDSCWSGRIVGENSINRVISLLRRASEQIGKDSFEIETVPKVGYRLKSFNPMAESVADADLLASPVDINVGKPQTSRRRMIGGAAAAGAALALPFTFSALGEGSVFLSGGHVPTREARELYDAGMKAQYIGTGATAEQAELFFRRAAQADPEWPDAWGSLAMSYRFMMDGGTSANQWRLVEQTRAAANRALDLDPDNAEALVALTLLRSPLDRWLEADREYAAMLDRFPDSFVLRNYYALLLADLGRFDEAVKHTTINVVANPLIPCLSVVHQAALWGAGRIQEADAEIERAYRLFAKNYVIWINRSNFLTYNGRASEALSFALDADGLPVELPPFLFERRRLTSQAVLTRSKADIDAVKRAIDVYVGRCLSANPFAICPDWPVQFLSFVGDIDAAFDILNSFYLWRGPLAPPGHAAKGPLSLRPSALLFMPTLANVRRDSRFASLVDEIGLTEQFRSSRRWPDSWKLGH